MRGIKIADDHLVIVIKQSEFRVLIGVEIPYKVKCNNIPWEPVACGNRGVFIITIEHICPKHSAQSLFLYILIESANVLFIKNVGRRIFASWTYADLIDLVVSDMNEALGLYHLNYLVYNIKNYFIALIQGRTIAVMIKLIRLCILCAQILLLRIVRIYLRDIGVGVRQILNVAKALNLGNDLKSELLGKTDKAAHILFFKERTFSTEATVRHKRLLVFTCQSLSTQPRLADLGTAIKSHSARELNNNRIISERDQNVSEKTAGKLKILKLWQADMHTAEFFIRSVLNTCHKKLIITAKLKQSVHRVKHSKSICGAYENSFLTYIEMVFFVCKLTCFFKSHLNSVRGKRLIKLLVKRQIKKISGKSFITIGGVSNFADSHCFAVR